MAAVTSNRGDAVAQPRKPAAARRRMAIFRSAVLTLAAVFFILPLLGLAEFSTRGASIGERSLAPWKEIAEYPELIDAIVASLELAVVTAAAMVVLLVPTLVWVRLRLPRLRKVVEFICLLPLTIPPIVLVVGLAPVYRWVTYLLGDRILNLAFAYLVLALPFAARALDAGLAAIDLRTLAEAARSLGASWWTVMVRVVMPNLTSALINALLLTVALVLGEFTLASLLNYVNVQVEMNLLGQANAQVSVAVALAALIAVFIVLLVLSLVGRLTQRHRLGGTR